MLFSLPRMKTSGLLILFGFRLAAAGEKLTRLVAMFMSPSVRLVGSVDAHWMGRKEKDMMM